jgi:hypothetical protein
MDNLTAMRDHLHTLWESTLQGILTVIDIAGLVGLFVIVIDDWGELGYVLLFVLLWLSSNYLIFKKQQERIRQLEASIATEQRSIDATLSLLTDEITQNLETFKTYWGKVTQLSESSYDPTQKRLALARQAIELNLPAWSRTIWETQMALLTKALSPEQLQQAQAIYSQLKEVSAIHSKLQSLMDEQQANLRADRWPDGGPILMGVAGPPRKFDKNAPVLWESLEQIAHTLTAQGNPLEQKNHQTAA